MSYSSVSQTVIHGGSPGGPQADLEGKSITIIVSDTKRIKNTPIYVCAKTATVG
jgi:hypothetical protein